MNMNLKKNAGSNYIYVLYYYFCGIKIYKTKEV